MMNLELCSCHILQFRDIGFVKLNDLEFFWFSVLHL